MASKYIPKLPPANIENARSWVRKFIHDTRTGELGLVHDVIKTPAGIRLLTRFPGETESREIALDPVPSMEYILPGDVQARYRPPTDADRDRLRSLATARA